MQQHGGKYFARDSHPPPHDQYVKSQSIQNMVMLHIKVTGITKCKMLTNNLPADPIPPTLGVKGPIQIFQNNVMLHIKLKGITNAAILWHYFLPAHPEGKVNWSKVNFFRTWAMLPIK